MAAEIPQPLTLNATRSRQAFLPSLIPVAVLLGLTVPRLGLKSMWLDEAAIADIVLRGNFAPGQLLTVPLGFALTERAFVQLTTTSEIGMRLLPLLFGVGAVWLTYVVAERFVQSRGVALIAALLLATNLNVTSYAMMLHPYTGDMFFALLLILIADQLCGHWNERWLLIYFAVAAVALLLSFPAVFVVGTVSLVILAAGINRRRAHSILILVMGHAGLVIWYAVYIVAIVLPQRRTIALDFPAAYPPHTGLLHIAAWYGDQAIQLLLYFFGSSTWLFAPFTPLPHGVVRLGVLLVRLLIVGTSPLLILAGSYVIGRHDRRRVMLLIGPLMMVAASALAHAYTFDGRGNGRTLLFACPALVILYSAGLSLPRNPSAPFRRSGLAALALAIIFVPSLITVEEAVAHPLASARLVDTEEIRGLVQQHLRSVLRPGDLIYVYYEVAAGFQYYDRQFLQPVLRYGETREVQLNRIGVIFGGKHPDRFDLYGAELFAAVRQWSPHRVWMLFGQHMAPFPKLMSAPEEYGIMARAARCGVVTAKWQSPNATLYLLSVPQPSLCGK